MRAHSVARLRRGLCAAQPQRGAEHPKGTSCGAELGALPLKQSSPTTPGRTPLLGAAQGGRENERNLMRHTVDTRMVFNLALCVVEQRKAQRAEGRGLSEGRRPEFRSPPLRLSSAETPAQPGDASGARFLWLLSFCKQKESTPARQARNPASLKPATYFPIDCSRSSITSCAAPSTPARSSERAVEICSLRVASGRQR